MAKYSAREYRAITWYALDNNMHMTLCRRPWVYYETKDGETFDIKLVEVMHLWEQHLKDEARRRARQRR